MSSSRQERLILGGLMVLGAIVFSLGNNWGLPSRRIDPFLFGSTENAWPGSKIIELGGKWEPDPQRPSDASSRPAKDRSQIVWLNETPQQQAEIIRQYRLFSSQPDELVTFRALAGMRNGNFDPRMYQYGGLWIYPVGALLKAASIFKLIELKPDFQTYLDHPEAFGRFYIVARAYSAIWGMIGIWTVFRLARRFSDRLIVPAAMSLCFTLMPVIINGAHEAKPHLAGAVLILLTVLAAVKYAETGAGKWAIVAGAIAGLAAGMVLTAAVAIIIVPLMTLLRPINWRERLKIISLAGGLAIILYFATNPYVAIHLFRDSKVLRENLAALSSAKAISGQSSDTSAIANARQLIIEGASMVGGVTGFIAVLIMAVNHTWWRDRRWRNVAVLLGAPSLLILVQFTILAGGKLGEFGRFFILPDVALVMAAVVVASCIGWGRKFETAILALFVFIAGFQGLAYLRGFIEDAQAKTSTRISAAEQLQALYAHGARSIGMRAEPAPYSLPPIDLTRWKLLLLPPDWQASSAADQPDVIISPADRIGTEGDIAGTPYTRTFRTSQMLWITTRISWADKPFEIWIKREMIQGNAH